MNDSVLHRYVPIFLFMGLTFLFPVVTLMIAKLIRPQSGGEGKLMPYECGVDPDSDARQRYAIRYYVVAILFVIFDVETVFFEEAEFLGRHPRQTVESQRSVGERQPGQFLRQSERRCGQQQQASYPPNRFGKKSNFYHRASEALARCAAAFGISPPRMWSQEISRAPPCQEKLLRLCIESVAT